MGNTVVSLLSGPISVTPKMSILNKRNPGFTSEIIPERLEKEETHKQHRNGITEK